MFLSSQTREKGLPLSAPPECESSVISGSESISLNALLSLPHILGPSRLLVHLGIKCRREGLGKAFYPVIIILGFGLHKPVKFRILKYVYNTKQIIQIYLGSRLGGIKTESRKEVPGFGSESLILFTFTTLLFAI